MLVPVFETNQAGEARRSAVEFARRAGASDPAIARIALVATEMATNLLKHTPGGYLIIDLFRDVGAEGIELLSLDSGPGIADVGRSMTDGYSTAGSPGTGLGAMSRQSDQLALFSRPGLGTAVMARFATGNAVAKSVAGRLGAISLPFPGEHVAGDGWAFDVDRTCCTLLVADGSGHGPQAAKAAEVAIATFTRHRSDDCVLLVERIHRALAPTRGAAIAVARIDVGAKVVRFVGVGNITGALLERGEVRRMVSHNGTAGHVAPRIREFTYPFAVAPTVLLHSDGLSAKWDVSDYPGLAAAHPSLIAGVLFRDHRRNRDDATIAVMRAA